MFNLKKILILVIQNEFKIFDKKNIIDSFDIFKESNDDLDSTDWYFPYFQNINYQLFYIIKNFRK